MLTRVPNRAQNRPNYNLSLIDGRFTFISWKIIFNNYYIMQKNPQKNMAPQNCFLVGDGRMGINALRFFLGRPSPWQLLMIGAGEGMVE